MRRFSLGSGYFLAALLGLAWSAACGSVAPAARTEDQSLDVALLQVEPPTGFVVDLTNTGQVPMAVCPCIGPPTHFIVFDLHYQDEDRKVSLPEILYSGSRLRRFYHCLKPGESIRVPVDFRRWEPIWDQQRETFPPFDLLVGSGSYRVRAQYFDKGKINLRSCKSFRGFATSEWVGFEVLDSSPSPDR